MSIYQKHRARSFRYGKLCLLLILLSSILVSTNTFSAHAFNAESPKPFVSFKIGNTNYTKALNKTIWMSKTNFFDGVVEVFLKDYKPKGKIKAGNKIRFKLKKGFKMKMYLHYYNGKKFSKTRIKNGTKIKKWNSDSFISASMQKGKYKTVFSLIEAKSSDY